MPHNLGEDVGNGISTPNKNVANEFNEGKNAHEQDNLKDYKRQT